VSRSLRVEHGPGIGLLALLVASVAIWWSSLAGTLHLALTSDAHTHILLILPLSLALIFFQRTEISGKPDGRWAGALLLALALGARTAASWGLAISTANRLSISMAALVVWWIGSVIVCFGLETFRARMFPLCFLFLVVPFPEQILNSITVFLQHSSAWGTEVLFHLARVPVTRDGIVLSIPGLDIEVAEECSSIRSSMMLIVTTLILAHLFLRLRRNQTLLVLAAIPLSVVKNAIRIFTIAELGTRVDPAYLDGRLHRNGGVIFLALGLAVIVVLLWLMRQGEAKRLNGFAA